MLGSSAKLGEVMKPAILAIALAMAFFALPARADEELLPKIEIEDEPEKSSSIIYRTPLQSEVIDQVVYTWRLSLYKPRDGRAPPDPFIELGIQHSVDLPFAIDKIMLDGGEELKVAWGGHERDCPKSQPCVYDESVAVSIPFALAHSVAGSSLKLVFIGQRKVKVIEIPGRTIQEFLKQSGT